MARNKDSFHQLIQESALVHIVNRITAKLNFSQPEEISFANKLIHAIDMRKFTSEMNSLTKEVRVHTNVGPFSEKREHGEVYAYEVQIIFEKNELVVTKKDPNKWAEFCRANKHDEVRIILIKSDSLPVVEAKLEVYRAFKYYVDYENMILHHVFEEYDEIAKLSFYRKLSSFYGEIEDLGESIPIHNLDEIINNAEDSVFTIGNVRDLCYDVHILNVGRANDRPYVCYSMFTVRTLKENLVEETLRKIGESLGSEICSGILRHIESRVKSELKKDLIQLKVELTKELFASISLVVMMAISFFMSSWLGFLVAVGTFFVSLVRFVDINSYEWRANVADEICMKVRENRRAILRKILPDIKKMCQQTSTDLKAVAKSLRELQQDIHLTDQKQFIALWEKRKGMHVEDRTLLKNHPNILKCISGVHDNGKQMVKVFLRGKEPTGVVEKRSGTSEKEKIGLSEISEIKKWFGNLNDYQFEIVYVDTIAAEIKKRAQEIKLRERKAPPIDQSTGMKIGRIIQRHCDRIHASYSNVIGIGISQVRCVGNTIIDSPCIVLYCLDKTITPFGEKPLPTEIEKIHCDSREDFVTFAMCPNSCPALNRDLPEPGCSIGLPNKKSSGSVGFLVRPRKSYDQSKRFFLTASHVAVENFEELYNRGFLSEQNPNYDELKIVHPFYKDGESTNVVGGVIESFIGDYTEDQNNPDRKTGLDFALVSNTIQTQEERRPVPVFNGDHRIFGGNFHVVKTGKATGTTIGKLKHSFLSIKVDSQFSAPGFFNFSNCYAISDSDKEHFFSHGDSGSGVFVFDNDFPMPLGIGFAFLNSETAVCRVDTIVKKLDLEIISCLCNFQRVFNERCKSARDDNPEYMDYS